MLSNEPDNVAGSIRHAVRGLARIDEDPQEWKWLALALHSALRGALICHLKKEHPTVAAGHRGQGGAMRYVLPLQVLLQSARNPNSCGDPSIRDGIAMSDADLAELVIFHEATAANLIVPDPGGGWFIDHPPMPEVAILVARCVGDIARAGYAFRGMDVDWHDRLRADLMRLVEWGEQRLRASADQQRRPRQ